MKIRIAKKEDVEQVWNIGNNVSEFKTAENVVIFWPKEILEKYTKKFNISSLGVLIFYRMNVWYYVTIRNEVDIIWITN